ncbi:MAG: carbamate kinase [Burkholderiales bacterium]|jgi:carbamate kinase|nr:carbamate kinase [Burkholderiales bacterium]
MRIVVALGGNALLPRGKAMSADLQRENIRIASTALAAVARKHQLILGHGNGPQIGLLALQAEALKHQIEPFPFDVLGAESQGMIGYVLAQEMSAQMPNTPVVCVLTQTEVDANDPAMKNPAKFIGPVYGKEEALRLADEKGWTVKPDGEYYRRVVPSPKPQHIVEIDAIRALVNRETVVIAGGGGGIPVVRNDGRRFGLEAVIDKDLCCSLMACELDADCLIIATDVSAAFVGWGAPDAKAIRMAHPDALEALDFAAGSMGPKVEAACAFVKRTGKRAAIGALEEIEAIVDGRAGTTVSTEIDGVIYHEGTMTVT